MALRFANAENDAAQDADNAENDAAENDAANAKDAAAVPVFELSRKTKNAAQDAKDAAAVLNDAAQDADKAQAAKNANGTGCRRRFRII